MQRVKPDRITYNTLIHIFAKSGKMDDMEHAQTILAQMEIDTNTRLRPNTFSYNTIIESWSKVRDGDGSCKAYAVLRKLLTTEKENMGVHSDSFSFNNVIFSLSRSGMRSSALRSEVHGKGVRVWKYEASNSYIWIFGSTPCVGEQRRQ